MPVLSSSKPRDRSQSKSLKKKQWFPRWMKSYQVEKTRRQSVAALSASDAQFLKAMSTEDGQQQQQELAEEAPSQGEGEYDLDENRTRSISGPTEAEQHQMKLTPQSQMSSSSTMNVSTSDWANTQMHDGDGFIEEVVEDAMKIESHRSKAESSMETIIEKMMGAITQSETNDVNTKELKFYVKVQSILLAILATINLYVHSTSSAQLLYERSFFSTLVVMIASFSYVAIAGGNMTKGGGGSGGKTVTKTMKTLLDNANTTLKHLRVKVARRGEDVDEDDETATNKSYDDFDINEHMLAQEQWGQPNGEDFMVRGKTYLLDKKKIHSTPALFKLLAVDLIETPDGNMKNIASHPKNRVARALARGDTKAFTFVFTFMIPGPPYLSYCAYWEVDMSLIEADTPFGTLAKRFFFGDSDEFRNDRFKFIPKIVEGNFAVKMAIKDTPTLMGHKLKQYYYQADHYFEMDVDISSSSVARNITGLVIGYAKTLQIDMAITLQGEAEDELPEVVLGTCSAVHVDVVAAKELE